MGCEHCPWIDREFNCFKPEDETCPEKVPFVPEEDNEEEEIEITVDEDFEVPFLNREEANND